MVEAVQNLKVGDIVQLRTNLFKNPRAAIMTAPGTQHMFIVVKTDPIVVCGVSSQMKYIERYPWSIVLDDWESEGFYKPSHVRTNNSGEVNDPNNVFKRIGHLSDHDLAKVLKAYQAAPQDVKLEHFNKLSLNGLKLDI